MADIKDGPLLALVLAMSDEQINLLQAAHDQFMEENDKEAASSASIRLERLCMLKSLVELQTGRAAEEANAPTPVEAITAYLQEHDPEVFPFTLTPYAGGKTLLLETVIGIKPDTDQWLEDTYPGMIVLSKAPRTTDNDTHPNEEGLGGKFTPTRNPGFIPERLPTPPRPDNAPAPHKPEINRGMPMSGEVQGMPGGNLGDK